jgi:hypothetical protein
VRAASNSIGDNKSIQSKGSRMKRLIAAVSFAALAAPAFAVEAGLP